MNNAYIDGYYDSYNDKTEYSGGLNLKLLGNDFGIYINKNFPIMFDYKHAKLEKAMNLYLAYGGLGLGFDVAMDNYNNEEYYTDQYLKENVIGLGGKVGLNVGSFDVAGRICFATGKSEMEDVHEFTDNTMLFYGAARMKLFESDKSIVYPKVELEMGTSKGVEKLFSKTDGEDEITINYMAFEPGIGLNYQLADEVLVIAAASCGFFNGKIKYSSSYPDSTVCYEYTYTWITLPKVELGLEAYLTKWLTVRAGINKSYFYNLNKGDYCSKADYEESYLDSDFYYSFGIGLEFGKFTMDWKICDDLLWKAPFIVSGNKSDFASSFTVKYSFK